ncbi:hypothetical protein EDD11_000461 [Mortierella claussenii]|nr:hypothetical protein EDD11_000461 [Mortierella claussenii]
MTKSSPPALKIKTLFTPSAFVCLLALSLCTTPSSARPITPPSPSISSDQKIDSVAHSIDTSSSSSSSASSKSSSPFRTVSRPINIQVDLVNNNNQNTIASFDDDSLLLIQRTEEQEQTLRQRQLLLEQLDPEEFARLQQEQDELEKVEQDRDQLLDNEEEEQLDQDPETVRRRQEESLGLWMTDAEFEALNQGVNGDSSNSISESSSVIADSHDSSRFDLYAENFKEETYSPEDEADEHTPEEEEEEVEVLEKTRRLGVTFKSRSSRSLMVANADKKRRLERQQPPTEEEMLQWPIINLAQFEDRQDETQDEYDEQA